MDHSCYKCGQVVEEGVAFCPHCSAPQIRVVLAEPPLPVLADCAAASQGSVALPASPTVPVPALSLQWSLALRPCALAALTASFLMALRLNALVAMLRIGFLAVVFYRQRQPGSLIRVANGAQLGALGGIIWFAMFSLLLGLAVFALREVPELQTELLKQMQQSASSPSVPQLQEFLNRIKTAPGVAEMVLSAFATALILGTLGGALGGVILGRRGKT